MTQEMINEIKNNPNYKALTSKRSSLAWTLSIIMCTIYYAFILVIAFDPTLLGAKLSDGITSVGIPVGIFIIISSFILTGIYVNKANTEFDELNNNLKKDIEKSMKKGA
jgi:uncharacterized membrane protein (DUF485 family)